MNGNFISEVRWANKVLIEVEFSFETCLKLNAVMQMGQEKFQ